MTDVTRRTLRLLTLLQSRTVWTGPELSDELGVTTRSVRRDIDRLRELGYPVLASNGHGGGYQLGAGRALPPLLLEGDEATAIAVSLRLAAGSGIDGLGEQALRALTKLDGILPPAVRAEVAGITGALHVVDTSGGPGAGSAAQDTQVGAAGDGGGGDGGHGRDRDGGHGGHSVGGHRTGHGIPAATLVGLARAVRDQVQVRLDYERRDAHRSARRVEPYRVLSLQGRWYLFAWDLDRGDWRTFRLDRMHEVTASTFRFTPRPTPDIETHVRESISVGAYPLGAEVRILCPASEVSPLIPAMAGTITPDGQDACILRTGARDLRWIAMQLAWLALPIEVIDPPELTEEIARIGTWARG